MLANNGHAHALRFDLSDDDEQPWVDAPAEDLTVQVRILPIDRFATPDESRLWHRRMIGGQRTACDLDADTRYAVSATRHESYKGPLCPHCFTSAELVASAEITQDD